MFVMLFRLEYHRERGEGVVERGFRYVYIPYSKTSESIGRLERWEFFGAGGEEGTGLVAVILVIKRRKIIW
jgi:hypothetical protein